MKKILFVTGSQDLYGEETLRQVDIDSKEMTKHLAAKIANVKIEYFGTVKNSEQIYVMAKEVNYKDDIAGIIVWCHTFSPAKMWIKGLAALQKPMLHLHTQFNEKLPYDTIDMDFMNLNQAAHGDREFGHICLRLNLKNAVVAGFYKDADVIKQISDWAAAAVALDFSRSLKVARFGDNMREVAVTEGDKVEAQIKMGWQVNTYGVGVLVDEINKVTDEEINALIAEYKAKYTIKTTDMDSIKEQAKYEIAMKKFFAARGIGAFANTFEDLYGMKQLPGLATQRLMGDGIGYGGEGDWKTSAMCAVMCKMAEGKKGSTGFMEDYTYDLTKGNELVLGAHMLEVSPSFAASKPEINVYPLGIGGKSPPARMIFDGVTGEGISVSLIDTGASFKLIVANIELIKQPKAMPKLPVARIMWKIKPSLQEGAKRWIEEGGAHHTVVSTALNANDMQTLAKMWGIDCIVIG